MGPVPAGVAGRGGPTPVLLDGSAEGRLLPHLIDRLRDPDLDRIDMAVSFVMKSGLARILLPLEDALDRGAHVRILTTDYLAITDPDALTQLADLAEGGDRRLEVRLFGGGSVAFHPKAYIFWSSAGEAAARLIAVGRRVRCLYEDQREPARRRCRVSRRIRPIAGGGISVCGGAQGGRSAPRSRPDGGLRGDLAGLERLGR